MDKIECLRLFNRLAESKSFSAVAPEFGLTQPMVSKRIAWLEGELGVSLFRRSTRGLQLTSEGQKLYENGRSVVDEFDAVLAGVKNEKLQLRGSVRITASLAFARIVIAPKLSELAKLHPDLKLNFQLSDGYIDLIENNVDIAFRLGQLPDSSLKAIKIGSFERKFYASKTYLKEFGVPKKLEDLHHHRCLYYSRLAAKPTWPITNHSGKASQFHIEPFMQSDATDIIREATINSLGVALMPNWMVDGQEDAQELKNILPSSGPEASPIYAVTVGAKELTAKQRAVIEFFKKKFVSK